MSQDTIADLNTNEQTIAVEPVPGHTTNQEPQGDRVAALQQQVARLTELVEQQQAQIAELAAARTADKSSIRRDKRASSGRASSRRALLKWGGAAAAAAAVAAVASEGQRAQAAPQSTGSIFYLGHTSDVNVAENPTGVQFDGTTAPGIVLFAADNTSSNAGTAQYPAAVGGYATGAHSVANGVYGYSTASGGSGVVGFGTTGVGVTAYSSDSGGNPALQGLVTGGGTGDGGHFVGASDAIGVSGSITAGTLGLGVYGFAVGNASAGIHGVTDSGYGVAGFAGTGIDLFAGGTGRVRQFPTSFSGPPTSGNYFQGEMLRDNNGELWLCISGNGTTVGTWVKVAHGAVGTTSGGAINFLATPIRLLDTRPGFPAVNMPGAPYGGGTTHTIQVTGVSSGGETIPNGVGMLGQVTAVATSVGGGYVSMLPHGVPFSGTANVAFAPNQTVSNSFASGLSLPGSGQPGAIDIYVSSNPTNVVMDIFAIIS